MPQRRRRRRRRHPRVIDLLGPCVDATHQLRYAGASAATTPTPRLPLVVLVGMAVIAGVAVIAAVVVARVGAVSGLLLTGSPWVETEPPGYHTSIDANMLQNKR